ncbi:MCE family protein [Mycobacterium sp. EPa45]|uniref:MCE family protein n=1 Tax=Mycobacterium sp. EPa45 TaxID=1545728 RepID=UPI000641BE07|nr:MCE family protein [Mycobacterium sp. EPa45]AKK27657.1 MCE-family protein [Mycobacterium sp. EPa45]
MPGPLPPKVKHPSILARYLRPLVGLLTVVVLVLIAGFAILAFRGEVFTDTVPITVVAERAGLVMNPDAKVKMRDVEVGRVASIEERPDGTAAIHLALDRKQASAIPANVGIDIAASTVFGAKFVDLIPPDVSSPKPVQAGQVVTAEHVTVEVNTLFQQLTDVISSIDPAKLNTTLGALSSGLNGRGEKLGRTISDFDSVLGDIDPSLPALSQDISNSSVVLRTFGDSAPDVMRILANSSRLSNTVVDQQANLDRFLLSAIGIADAGNDVVGGNRQALTDTLHLLVPTTGLLDRYAPALYCLLSGLVPLVDAPPLRLPGAEVSTGFTWGVERYRYPQDLPKVAAKGGPQCTGFPVQFEGRVPYVVADTGTNPYRYDNPGIILNADGIKRLLFGDFDGPPRNSMQIGQPG